MEIKHRLTEKPKLPLYTHAMPQDDASKTTANSENSYNENSMEKQTLSFAILYHNTDKKRRQQS